MRESLRIRESDREREGDFDSSKCPRKYLNSKQVSVVQVYIQIQGTNRTLDPESSILVGMILEMWL